MSLYRSLAHTHLVDEGKAVDVRYSDSKAFGIVPRSIILDELTACGLVRYTLLWVENCLWLHLKIGGEQS